MLTPEEFLDSLLTVDSISHEYDAAKAREYYLRTRKLKGRKKGQVEDLKGRRPAGKPISKANRAAARRKARIAKIKRLKAKLARLEKILAELVKQAKARSGVKTPTKAATTAAPKASTTKKPLTAAQKKEAAKKAEQYREKNKKPVAEDKALEQKIAAVRKKIAKMKEQLAASRKKKQGAKSNTKTASKAVDTK